MSLHKTYTDEERAGLKLHGLDQKGPSQLSDGFVLGMRYALHAAIAQVLKDHGRGKELGVVLDLCKDSECMRCAEIVCPHGEALHFHHDGCPSCSTNGAGIHKEPIEAQWDDKTSRIVTQPDKTRGR